MKIQCEKPKCDKEETLRSCILGFKSKQSLKARLYLQFEDNNRLDSQGLKRAWSLWPAGQWFKTQTDFVNDQKWFPPDRCLCLNKINRKVSLQLLAAHSLTATFQPSTARFSAAALHLWEEQNLHALQARDMLGSPHPSSLQLSAATAMIHLPRTSLISTVEVWNPSL